MMPSEQYIVTRDCGDWAVRLGGLWLGRFASCPRAIRAAVEAADKPAALQDSAEVVVERSPYDRYTVWVRGKDGFSD
jgi:hypothetical protein